MGTSLQIVLKQRREDMAGIRDITNVWNTVTELDLRPLREQAEGGVRIAVVGKAGSGRHALAEHMRQDPSRPGNKTASPLLIADLEKAARLPDVDLVILLMGVADSDDHAERRLVRTWLDAGLRVFALINRPAQGLDTTGAGLTIEPWLNWGKRNVLIGPVEDVDFLLKEFVPAVMRLLPGHHLALGRYFPLFRVPVARHLISDTGFSNAAYSLSTGLVEVVPILNIPLNVADTFVLTKNQIFLVYKIGLALGMPVELQSYISTFGGVLGAGFFWRQMAHMLVGLIPGIGIIPKVAVAYAGTSVVGNVVLQWYLTGRHVSKEQIRKLYAQAYATGKVLAPKLRRDQKRLPAGRKKKTSRSQAAVNQPAATQLAQPARGGTCPNCGKTNAAEAPFCQYCGR